MEDETFLKSREIIDWIKTHPESAMADFGFMLLAASVKKDEVEEPLRRYCVTLLGHINYQDSLEADIAPYFQQILDELDRPMQQNVLQSALKPKDP